MGAITTELSGNTRPAAVAGRFYPAQADALRAQIDALLAQVPGNGRVPKAIIAPHAGYRYSGWVAAAAYAHLATGRGTLRRAVLLGPAHRVPLRGLAASSAAAFTTPLGSVPVAQVAWETILALPQVRIWDGAHAEEHSLEVQLPFLQRLLPDVAIVPLLAGEASAEDVAGVLEALWDGPDTAVIVSSDLSHFHDYATAQKLDAATAQAITALDSTALDHGSACGHIAINGLLRVARRHRLSAETIMLRNSGDSEGPRDRVVGYGAFLFYEPENYLTR